MERSSKGETRCLLDYPSGADSHCYACDAACCRSFPAVHISGPEYSQLRLIGATRLQFSLLGRHKLLIEDGCEFLLQGKCSIYAERPSVCRRFMCRGD